MSWYTDIKTWIANNIRTNHQHEITGAKMNTVLNDIVDEVENKVDKVEGKGLSTNDYTDTDKAKVASALQTETDPTVPSWAKAQTKPTYTASEVGAIPSSDKGANGGVATLDSGGKVPQSQLPSYVDDVLEYANLASFPATGESGKIYVALDTNKTYRWSGSSYVEISQSLALGETSSTAFAGNRGKAIEDKIPSSASSSNKLATTSDLAGKQDTISDLATIRSGAAAGATAYQKPSGGIPKTDLASGVQTSLGKADTAFQKPSGGIPESDLSSDVQQALQKHFKGWYVSSSALPVNPVVGDYAYVKGAETTDPAAIYECTTSGSWSDSGRTVDTSNVQTFASGEEVNEVHIVNDLITGGTEDVLSAEQGKDVNGRLTSVEISVNGKVPSEDEDIDLTQYSDVTATIYNGAWLVNQSYQGKFIPCVPNRQYKFVGNNSYTSFFAFLKDDEHTAGSQVQFAEGYSGAVNVLAGEEATYTAPTDATFLYVSTKYSNNNNEFSSVTLIGEEGVVGLVSRVEGIKRTIYGVSTDDEEIDISQYAEQQNFINFTEYFINQYYKGRFIPCVAGAKYRFKANSEYTSIVAFLHSIDNVSSGVTPDFAEGWEITLNVLAGEEVVLFAPNDATYIWCASLNGALQPCDFQKIEQLGEEIQKGLADLSILPQTSMRYPQKELPVISFVFDDIDENDSDVVRLFDYYGLKCGFAYIASEAKIEEHKDKYLEWQRRGYSILNHSVDGKKFDSTNYPTIASAYYAIMTAKQRLEAAGFVINGFVAPSSEFLSDYIDALRNTHQYAYTTADLANTRSSNPCNISRLSLQTTKLADILGDATNQQSIAFYLAANRQLTFYGHSADFGNIYGGEVFSIDKIRQVVERCISLRNEGRCVILSPDNMADYFFRGQQIILSNTSDNRPLSPCEGMMFFDKTIGKPIWYNGVNWVDSNGTTV